MRFHTKYPFIGYDPEKLWCAFYFDLHTQLAEFKETKRQAAGPTEKRVARSNAFYDRLKDIFPKQDSFFGDVSDKNWKACKKFSNQIDEIYFSVENAQAVITSKASNLCPSLALKLEGSFLEASLHNAQNPGLAIPMWMYGFSALRTVYSAFGISCQFLPTISFDDKDFVFEVPFLKGKAVESRRDLLDDKIQCCMGRFQSGTRHNLNGQYDPFGVNGTIVDVVQFQSKDTSHKFVGRVSYSSGNHVQRNLTASCLFILAVLQAHHSYQARDFAVGRY